MLDTLVDYNHRNNLPLSNEKLQQVVSKLIAEMEEEERDAKCNANDLTMDTFYNYSPITTNTQGEIANMKNKRQISLGVLAETIKGFNGFTIQSTINDSAYCDSEEDDTESNPNSDSKVATHTSDRKKRKVTDTDTTNRNSPQKLLINRLIPEIIKVTIPPIDQTVAEDAAGNVETLHALRTAPSKEVVTDTSRNAACVFWTPAKVIRHGTDGTTPCYGNTYIGPTRLDSPVCIGGSTTSSQIRTGRQDIISPGGPSVLSGSGTSNHWTLPLMEFTPNIGILRQLGVRELVENSPTNPTPKSTRAVR